MIFTTKAEYGVRLLLRLGMQHDSHPTSLKAIAEDEQLPLAYLERIAASLKKGGFINSTRGAHGGYELALPAQEITMDGVVMALEGTIAPMDCFYEDERGGRVLCSHVADEHHCATKFMWTRVQHGVVESLRRTTLAELIEFANRTTKHREPKTRSPEVKTHPLPDVSPAANGRGSLMTQLADSQLAPNSDSLNPYQQT